MSLRYRYNLDASNSAPPVLPPKVEVPLPKAEQRKSFGVAHLFSSAGHPNDPKGLTSKSPPKLPPTTYHLPAPAKDPGTFQKFTAVEVKRLGRRFRKLDSDQSGTVSLKEFFTIPEIKKNVLANRVIEVFDTNKNGEVDFSEFVLGMSQFASDNMEGRLRFAFRIYDLDGNGFITTGELFQVIKLMVGDNLKDVQIQEAVDHTFMMGDTNRDGKISFNEFAALVRNKGALRPGAALQGI